jgi:hypothetical protein
VVQNLNREIAALQRQLEPLRFWEFKKRKEIEVRLYRLKGALAGIKGELSVLTAQKKPPDAYQAIVLAEYDHHLHSRFVSDFTK